MRSPRDYIPSRVGAVRKRLREIESAVKSVDVSLTDLEIAIGREGLVAGKDSETWNGLSRARDVLAVHAMRVLQSVGGNKARAARILDVNVKTLSAWLSRWEKPSEALGQ